MICKTTVATTIGFIVNTSGRISGSILLIAPQLTNRVIKTTDQSIG